VRGYEAAGVAAIQIEDQEMPKKCGHTPGRRVVPAEEMALKIKVAVEARRHDETMIVARTDARTAHGLDEALRRAALYEAAGADVIFVESPETEAELERIGGSEQALARQHGRIRQDAAGQSRTAEEVGF
jgi:2-methylisocitrate lyase-like PEP mutase family enzyme